MGVFSGQVAADSATVASGVNIKTGTIADLALVVTGPVVDGILYVRNSGCGRNEWQ